MIRCRRFNKFRPEVEYLEDRTVPTTYTVNSLADNGTGSADQGDLRYILNRANSQNHGTAASPDVISFSGITISPGNNTIFVGSGAAGAIPLPAITDKMIIDATTAIGFDNLAGVMLTIDGSQLSNGANGLLLLGGNATVQGLAIENFPGNGILVNSSNNLIGGDRVGVDANGNPNNPTGRVTSTIPPTTVPPVIVRPPQGNVIGGNGGDGVRIANGANNNLLEGNFIGTDVTGVNGSQNGGNGVYILRSNGNKLYGTTPPDQNNPFVFYNVISGNAKNGLLIQDSNNSVVFANFFGLGADNKTAVGNALDGILVTGTSDSTRIGANIPLGNVSSGNLKNGLEIAGTASRTKSVNTFAGTAAFNTSQVGNGQHGILITSPGGTQHLGTSTFNTLVLTTVVGGNALDGIHVGGQAKGVQISQVVVGMETNGNVPEPNGRDGIAIVGSSSNIAIGGFQPSVVGEKEDGSFQEATSVISGNGRNGINVQSGVSDVRILNNFIGLQIDGASPAPNGTNGIYIYGASGVQIGAALGNKSPKYRNVVAFNNNDGILIDHGTSDSILGNEIYSNGRLGINLLDGGNNNQLPPTLTSATVSDSTGLTTVSGSITGKPNTKYQIELFASLTASTPGNGQYFLGFVNVTTNAAGTGQFQASGLVNPAPLTSDSITATATDPTGNTSAFSTAIVATSVA